MRTKVARTFNRLTCGHYWIKINALPDTNWEYAKWYCELNPAVFCCPRCGKRRIESRYWLPINAIWEWER